MSWVEVTLICIGAYVLWLILFPLALKLVSEDECILTEEGPTVHFWSEVFPPFVIFDIAVFFAFWWSEETEKIAVAKREWLKTRKTKSKDKLLRPSQKPDERDFGKKM